MSLVPRLAIFACFSILIAAFWLVPAGSTDMATLVGALQLAGSGIAAGCCFLAAARSSADDRKAWRAFGIGSSLYLAGNLGYMIVSLLEIDPGFPSPLEAVFLVMALVFANGMFSYAKLRGRISRIDVLNFILIYCAVTLASLFGLASGLGQSILSPFGTLVGFLYPALWLSVAASGCISLLLYDHGRKAFPLMLMVIALFAEAGADYRYVLTLMDGTYRLGGVTQFLWMVSTALIAWAALDHAALAKSGMAAEGAPLRRRTDRGIAQATVPAMAVATILLAGSATGALGSGPYVWLSGVLASIFAVVTGLREHWIIQTQRQLRAVVEDGRVDIERNRERIRSVLESTNDSVLVVDHDWKVIYFNQRLVRIIKENPQNLQIGVKLWDLFPRAETTGEAAQYRKAVETGQPVEFELFLPDQRMWLGINAYPTSDGLSIFTRDISESRRVREEITHMAHHDPLTGLGNRLLFQEVLAEAMASGNSVATMVLDLDHFKEVNDTLGHPVGDAVLMETARRLQACARPQDTLARLGGDEFAVIIAGYTGRTELIGLAQRFIDAAIEPHQIEGLTVRVGASAGIATAVAGRDDAAQVFKNADIALYIAKSDARGAYCFFEPSMEVGMQQRQALRADLAAALDRGEFELEFQPLVDLKRGKVCGFETLLRWRHPIQGPISPAVFIPLAEDSGLMISIGDWVLQQACLEAQKWPRDISLAVNLSTKQFGDAALADKIAATLEFTGFAPERLELEITESVLLKDDKANLLTLRRLRELGIRIALDDFGTGYSSLGYLQRFPFSKIKIDRSFIDGLPDNDESQAIVRSVIGLGQALGMRVTAEGVETQAQLDWVRNGCDEAQGYLLSRPVTPAQVSNVIAEIDGGRRQLAS